MANPGAPKALFTCSNNNKVDAQSRIAKQWWESSCRAVLAPWDSGMGLGRQAQASTQQLVWGNHEKKDIF